MAYDVDFWYISQDACQISTDFTPFSEHEEESIYMKTSDFFKMIERFTDPDLERKAKAFDEIMKGELGVYYYKAKAWDNYIAEVRERVRFTENTDDDVERETQKVIDYYMEDE
ncbi:hypothetical protein [Staphylococcus succinus]|uniref:hypothetical protein n=1 Tax=Staphylococcus succinus TaxID=61015 RepID=UPI00301D0EA8